MAARRRGGKRKQSVGEKRVALLTGSKAFRKSDFERDRKGNLTERGKRRARDLERQFGTAINSKNFQLVRTADPEKQRALRRIAPDESKRSRSGVFAIQTDTRLSRNKTVPNRVKRVSVRRDGTLSVKLDSGRTQRFAPVSVAQSFTERGQRRLQRFAEELPPETKFEIRLGRGRHSKVFGSYEEAEAFVEELAAGTASEGVSAKGDGSKGDFEEFFGGIVAIT